MHRFCNLKWQSGMRRAWAVEKHQPTLIAVQGVCFTWMPELET
jgi:hypothetical protein